MFPSLSVDFKRRHEHVQWILSMIDRLEKVNQRFASYPKL